MDGALFVVGTPIGNLGDITLRALDVLKASDLVVCEDTRITRRLLNRYGIQKPTISHFSGNETRKIPEILDLIAGGKRVAFATDAGTPAVSDPGYLLVKACRDRGYPVTCVPGPSSLTASLSVSGLPTDRVLFLGFPPRRKASGSTSSPPCARRPIRWSFSSPRTGSGPSSRR